ncbi:MAG: endonuclease III domain-containing protein [Anaerolineae bacterium]
MQEPDISPIAHLVHEKLVSYYGLPEPKKQQDPLSELVQTILSQNTSDRNTARSFAELRRRFPTWEGVLKANVEEVIEAIQVGGLARIKAPRIQAILREISLERGNLALEFLREMSASAVKDYLIKLYGVGPKTAACVLLFSLGVPALPVDTHVHRVSLRVGLVPPKSSVEKTQEILEASLPEQAYYPFHLNMIRHGRTLCTAANIKCAVCPLNTLCEYAHLHTPDTLL